MLLTSDLLADYALETSDRRLPGDVSEKVERLVLDSLGCCLGGYASPPSKRLRSIYGGRGGGSIADPGNGAGGPDAATVFCSGAMTSVASAALLNSTMVRYLDYNDTYISQGRACHPSDHIPALVSVAESEGRTGEELIEAISLAYEIEGLGLDTGATWENGYDYVTWGGYATAVAAGWLMGLSREELIDAIGIVGASTVSLGISRRGAVSMWKGIATAWATRAGVQACRMARAGVTGPGAVFEGPSGFFETVAGRELEVDRLGGRDGADYRIANVHLKPFPCGYYMQPMIASVREIVAERGIGADEVEAVTIRTFAEAAEILADPEKWSKDLSRESADHSIPYTTAIAIREGDVRPEHYRREYRRDKRIHDLMDRVSVEEAEGLTEFAEANPDATPVVVELATGDARHETRIDYAPGHARNPLSRDELESKVSALAAPYLSADQFAALLNRCEELEALDRVDPLVSALTV